MAREPLAEKDYPTPAQIRALANDPKYRGWMRMGVEAKLERLDHTNSIEPEAYDKETGLIRNGDPTVRMTIDRVLQCGLVSLANYLERTQ